MRLQFVRVLCFACRARVWSLYSNFRLRLQLWALQFLGSGSNIWKLLARVPEQFGSKYHKKHHSMCITRLPHKLSLWNRNPNFRLRFHHLKVFGSDSTARGGVGLHSPATPPPQPDSTSTALLQRPVANLTSGLTKCWSLLRNNNMSTNHQTFTSSCGSRHFSACNQGSHCVFLPRSAFFSRTGCLGLSMKNRIKSGFCEVINSSATSM